MFQTVIEAGPDGSVLERPGAISKSATSEVVLGKHLTHFNVHALDRPPRGGALAQRPPGDRRAVAARHTGHDLHRPAARLHRERRRLVRRRRLLAVARAARPRGAARRRASCASSPTSPGRSTARSASARRCTPRSTSRPSRGGPGSRAPSGRTPTSSPSSPWPTCWASRGRPSARTRVACTSKHFPGGGPQKDGEDAHFPYGREQVYPGGRFDDHLAPFPPVIEAGTAAVMPYYGMPIGLELDGEPVEEVGFGYNRQIVTGLLRDRLGYDGVVVTDWELVNDNHVGDQVLPARAWGVEHLDPHERVERILDAGADQFGGEECVELLLDLVEEGRVTEERVDVSARRLLTVKFRLGLFDDPFVDEDRAAATVGRADFRAAGYAAQAASVTVLTNGAGGREPVLPLRPGLRVYAENLSDEAVAALGTRVPRPQDADLAVVRLPAPFEPRSDLFLESWFHQGSLDFPPGLVVRLQRIAAHCPLVARRRARPPGGADAAAARRLRGGRELRHVRRGARRRPHRAGRAAGPAAVRPAALDGAGPAARRGRPGLRRPAVRLRPRPVT